LNSQYPNDASIAELTDQIFTSINIVEDQVSKLIFSTDRNLQLVAASYPIAYDEITGSAVEIVEADDESSSENSSAISLPPISAPEALTTKHDVEK
jgi:hypothetical protein